MKRWRIERPLLIIVVLWLAILPFGVYRLYATDEVQYFAYLRSLYFDHDLNFANEYQYFADAGQARGDPAVFNALLKDRSSDPPRNPKTGLYRNVAPIGSAMLWSPFYIAADMLVRMGIFDAPADGFSKPYIVAVCLASAFYSLLGMILSYRLARRWTGQWAAGVATITLWLASPLVWYTYIQMPWSHSTGLAMVALFLTIWLSPQNIEHRTKNINQNKEQRAKSKEEQSQRDFTQRVSDSARTLVQGRAERSWLNWIALAVVGGLMVLVREQLGLFLLLPAIEGMIAYYQYAKQRDWTHIRILFAKHAVFLVLFVVMLLPQLWVYSVLYGQPRPSGTVSGKLNLISYKFFATLFDPRRGAFMWHPLLALSLIGLIFLWRRDRLLTALLAIGFLAQNYINGAFGSTWHLSGSFGFRRLIECLPIFIIGLAVLIERLQWKRSIIATLALCFVLWNGGLVLQAATDKEVRGAGLKWNTMLQDQFAVPRKAWQKANELLFDRCGVLKNC